MSFLLYVLCAKKLLKINFGCHRVVETQEGNKLSLTVLTVITPQGSIKWNSH